MDSCDNIPAGNELQYIAHKVHDIDKAMGKIETKLEYMPDEDKVKELAGEVFERKIKKTPISTEIPRHSVFTANDWRGVVRVVLIIAGLLGIGGGAGYKISVDNSDSKQKMEQKE